MKYRSTRSNRPVSSADFTFEDCILRGLAPDGGLFLPEYFPGVSADTLASWGELNYQDVVIEICKLYIDDAEIPHADLKTLVDRAFQEFSLPEIVRVVVGMMQSSCRNYAPLVAELFHGPTLAFKDLSVACFSSFLEYFLNKQNKQATIIVATSGDTGGAVVNAFKGLQSVNVIVMFPVGRCNEIQELQMTTVCDENIHCFAVEGTSDDEDQVMAAVLNDEPFANRHNLTVANSINWARLLIQVSNYFFIYLKSGIAIGETLSLIVPTGGAGNVTGGCIARKMGLPVVLTVAVNANDCLHRFIQKGVLKTSDQVTKTLASAMDIQVPYNVERLLSIYERDLPNEDVTPLVKSFFDDGHEVKISEVLLTKLKEVIVHSYCANDEEILKTMNHCWRDFQYAACPHTATAMACFYNHVRQDQPPRTVCIATASPYKFPEVLQAAGIPSDDGAILQKLRQLPVRRADSMVRGGDWIEQLRLKIEAITESRENRKTAAK